MIHVAQHQLILHNIGKQVSINWVNHLTPPGVHHLWTETAYGQALTP